MGKPWVQSYSRASCGLRYPVPLSWCWRAIKVPGRRPDTLSSLRTLCSSRGKKKKKNHVRVLPALLFLARPQDSQTAKESGRRRGVSSGLAQVGQVSHHTLTSPCPGRPLIPASGPTGSLPPTSLGADHWLPRPGLGAGPCCTHLPPGAERGSDCWAPALATGHASRAAPAHPPPPAAGAPPLRSAARPPSPCGRSVPPPAPSRGASHF